MKLQETTRRIGNSKKALLVGLAAGVAMAGSVAVFGTPQQADAAFTDKIVFLSARTTGKGVNNPTGDLEVFTINPNGTGLKQLTRNETVEYVPTLSSDGKKIAFRREGSQASNPNGDQEIYTVNVSDGTGQWNLTDNDATDAAAKWGGG